MPTHEIPNMTPSSTEISSQLRTDENQKTKPERAQKRLTCLLNTEGKQVCIWLGHPVCTVHAAWWPCKSFQNISCDAPCTARPPEQQKTVATCTQTAPFCFLTCIQCTAQVLKIRSEETLCFLFFGSSRGGDGSCYQKTFSWQAGSVFSNTILLIPPTNRNCKLFSQCPKWAADDCTCQMDKDVTGRQGNQISSFSELF